MRHGECSRMKTSGAWGEARTKGPMTTLGTSYSVRWRACAVAVGTSNTIVGAVLGLMYGLYSFPFTGGSIHADGNAGHVLSSIIVSAVFGLIFPTALSLLAMIPRRARSHLWPVSVAVGPTAFSLLSFVFVWSFPVVLAFVAVASIAGSALSIVAVTLVHGVQRKDGDR